MTEYPFEIKPMAIGTVLDHTFRIYRANFFAIAFFALVISGLASGLVQVAAFLISGGNVQDSSGAGFLRMFTSGSFDDFMNTFETSYYADPFEMLANMFTFSLTTILFNGLVTLFGGSFVTGGIANISAGYYHGVTEKTSVWLKRSGRYYWKFVLLQLCVNISAFVCNIIMIIPAIILYIVLIVVLVTTIMASGILGIIFAIFIVIFLISFVLFLSSVIQSALNMSFAAAVCEGRYHFEGVLRGFGVFFSRFWKSSWTAVLISIIVFFCTFAVELIYGAIFMWLPVPALINNIVTVLMNSLFIPIPIIASCLLYLNNRIEKEGYDLALMAEAISN